MSDERALTIRQPYASLIVAGIKDVENRSWPVPSTLPQWWRCTGCRAERAPHEGPDDECACQLVDAYSDWVERGPFPFRLWIHAGKGIDYAAFTQHPDIKRLWARPRYPAGVLLGSVLVTGCHPWEDCIAGTAPQGAPGCSPWAEDDAYHWTLTNPQLLPEPIPMKGRQGLWRVPHSSGGFLVGSSSPSTPSTSTD